LPTSLNFEIKYTKKERTIPVTKIYDKIIGITKANNSEVNYCVDSVFLENRLSMA